MLYKEPHQEKTPGFFLRLTRNCSEYTKDFWMRNGSKHEEDFPLAYALLVHDSIERVSRLLRAVYRPWNIYCVHVDHKAPSIFHDAITAITRCLPNVVTASKYEWVVYDGFSRLQAEINCFKDILESKVKWKYAMNLAGHDFPLMDNNHITQVLKNMQGYNVIRSVLPQDQSIRDRYSFVHERILLGNHEKISRTSHLKPSPPGNVSVRHGSEHNIFSRSFISYVLHAPFAQSLLHWFRDTQLPVQHFWATLQAQKATPGGSSRQQWPDLGWVSKCNSNGTSSIDTKARQSGNRMNKDRCVVSVADLKWLTRQRSMFVSKLDLSYDHVAYSCLETLVLGNTQNNKT